MEIQSFCADCLDFYRDPHGSPWGGMSFVVSSSQVLSYCGTCSHSKKRRNSLHLIISVFLCSMTEWTNSEKDGLLSYTQRLEPGLDWWRFSLEPIEACSLTGGDTCNIWQSICPTQGASLLILLLDRTKTMYKQWLTMVSGTYSSGSSIKWALFVFSG